MSNRINTISQFDQINKTIRFLDREAVCGHCHCATTQSEPACYSIIGQVQGDVMITNVVSPVDKNILRKSRITLTEYEGEPRVDSRRLVQQLGGKHKNFTALIERYLGMLNEFGFVPFKTDRYFNSRQERFALLNEDQALLLLALSCNTKRLVSLKFALVLAFREARYGYACQTLKARREEASQSGRRLARWRHEKSGIYQHVSQLREQLKLPLEIDINFE